MPTQSTAYTLNITGAKSKINKSMADYTESVKITKGFINVKSVELINASGESVSATDASEEAVVTAKLNVLNTTGVDENAVLNYGLYNNGYMEGSDYVDAYLETNKITPLAINVPYTDSEQIIKIFLWDAFSTHESYFSGFEFAAE